MSTTTMYRRFETTNSDYALLREGTPERFEVRELEPTDRHPMNWIDFKLTRESAWAAAQAQPLPVVFIDRDGTERELGVVFDAEAFERAMYGGYVSYGYSMSDGYYAPLRFESWVADFRRNPASQAGLHGHNDAHQLTKLALPLYEQHLGLVA